MEHTLLPRNVERRQWVNRYYRIKVLSNVAELNSSHARAKAQRSGIVCQADLRVKHTRVFLLPKNSLGGGKMDAGPHLCSKERYSNKNQRGVQFLPLDMVEEFTP